MKEFRLLRPDEIEVKVKQVSAKGAVALLYKTARTDMSLLDETVGAENWECDYKVVNCNLYCGIGITFENGKTVWKWDCGIESREDDGNEKKGEASDAFKRAGFKWGIGRELYTAPSIFLKIPTYKNDRGEYKLQNPYAKYKLSNIAYNDDRSICLVEIRDDSNNVVFLKGKLSNTRTLSPKKGTPLSVDTICEAEEIGCDLHKWARHFGKAYEDLTDEEAQEGIAAKRAYLASLKPSEEA